MCTCIVIILVNRKGKGKLWVVSSYHNFGGITAVLAPATFTGDAEIANVVGANVAPTELL